MTAKLVRGQATERTYIGQQPGAGRFACRHHGVRGSGDLWITELVITYDERPYLTVSIMEFRGEQVAIETQYFSEPFEPAAWRARWADSGQRA